MADAKICGCSSPLCTVAQNYASTDSQARIENTVFHLQLVDSVDGKPGNTEGQLHVYGKKKKRKSTCKGIQAVPNRIVQGLTPFAGSFITTESSIGIPEPHGHGWSERADCEAGTEFTEEGKRTSQEVWRRRK